MRFKVTGGQDGQSGIEFAGKRYEPGDEVEMTAKQADWLVEQGYLEDPKKPATKTVEVAPEPEPVVEPVVEEAVVADDVTEDEVF